MKTKSFQIRLDPNDHRELKTFCASKGISMQEFFTKAAREYKDKWAV